jgi:hypothetical protein
MKLKDIIMLLLGAGVIVGLGLLVAFAPQAEPFVYRPVEITGSSILALPARSPEVALVGAEVKQAGFVTVNISHGNAPGPNVGESQLLEPGSYPNLEVHLHEPMNGVDNYFVLLFVDDGDGVYEPGVDLPVMSDGKVVEQIIPM